MQMYYSVNQPGKARDIYVQLAVVYQEKLLYFSSFKTNEQIDMRREIYTDMERYRAVVTVLLVEDSKEYALSEAIKFNEYIKLFPYLYNPDEGIELEGQLRLQKYPKWIHYKSYYKANLINCIF